VIREPAGAVLSQVIREPHVAIRDALVSYERFYSRLIPYGRAFVAGEFEDVTTDLAGVIRRVNDRFGTSYAEFQASPENVRRCMQLIADRPTEDPELRALLLGFESGVVSLPELMAGRANTAGASSTRGGSADTWIPSEERRIAKERLRERWEAPGLVGLRERANETFSAFLRSTGRKA
jgi:hypothetical protein